MKSFKLAILLLFVSCAFAMAGRKLNPSAQQNYAAFSVSDETSWDRAETTASEFLLNNSNALNGVEDFYTKGVSIDDLGMAHTRVQQTQNGIAVFGGEAIVHMGAKGTVVRLTDKFVRGLRVETTPALSGSQAVSAATKGLGRGELVNKPDAELLILRHGGADHLVYRVALKTNKHTMPIKFIDAVSGKLVWEYDNLMTQRNRNTYDVNNGTNLPGTLVRNENSGASGDAVLDEAHDNAGTTYDYYSQVHGRDSYNGSGATISSHVHFDNNYVNAYWDGSRMVYGDGDGSQSGPLTVLDIVGHELTHAVTEYSSGLIYANESGALNEAMSDIFAAAIEAWADGGVSGDTWKVGEDAWTPGTPGDALRYMNDPQAGGDYDYYPTRYTGSQDNGGVHWNSGIANLAFYLASEGGTHPRGSTSNVVTGIGISDAAAIFYRANTVYMTASSTFADARSATDSAATDLFGAGSQQAIQMGNAWTAVGVAAPPSYDVIDTQSNLSGAANSEQTFGPYDATNANAIRFQMSGGSGDADLYVRYGAAPTTSNYDCRPYLSGNSETCEFNPSQSGLYYVMIRAYSAYSGVTLTVSADGGVTGPTTETSCTDGIDNDGDGQVDCADSDCSTDSACTGPTTETSCTDGIDNDGDGLVDCADTDCSSDAACQTTGWQVIYSTDFESGWGSFNDGGSDCRRSANDASYANSGSYCVRLRDNTSTSNTTSDSLNISGYSQIKIEYSMYARSMENNEDYFVEINTGSGWTVIANYARGTDFNNNTRYNDEVTANVSGSSMQVRFRNDASGNSDWVYIDDVVISGQ